MSTLTSILPAYQQEYRGFCQERARQNTPALQQGGGSVADTVRQQHASGAYLPIWFGGAAGSIRAARQAGPGTLPAAAATAPAYTGLLHRDCRQQGLGLTLIFQVTGKKKQVTLFRAFKNDLLLHQKPGSPDKFSLTT